MVFNERSLEGYMQIDHRNSPGFTPEEAIRNGWRRIAGNMGPGTNTEVGFRLCAHCQRMVILNPDRTRDRERCWKCFEYICDECKLAEKSGAECQPFTMIVDKWADAAANGKPFNLKIAYDKPSTP